MVREDDCAHCGVDRLHSLISGRARPVLLPWPVKEADEFSCARDWILVMHHMPAIRYAPVRVFAESCIANVGGTESVHLQVMAGH